VQHGDSHPSVAITFGSMPLVHSTAAAGKMDLCITLDGTLPGCTYKIIAQEVNLVTGSVIQQSENTIEGRDVFHAKQATVEVWTHATNHAQHDNFRRFVVTIRYTHEGLSGDEALLARHNVTIHIAPLLASERGHHHCSRSACLTTEDGHAVWEKVDEWQGGGDGAWEGKAKLQGKTEVESTLASGARIRGQREPFLSMGWSHASYDPAQNAHFISLAWEGEDLDVEDDDADAHDPHVLPLESGSDRAGTGRHVLVLLDNVLVSALSGVLSPFLSLCRSLARSLPLSLALSLYRNKHMYMCINTHLYPVCMYIHIHWCITVYDACTRAFNDAATLVSKCMLPTVCSLASCTDT